ncbi:cob(I)yrinic acid a,c-diamide adenosyltransferase [Myxococcota bacterium]|jgi:cob(I)alamin adenosyltransferase|nr:cob(I)yrinic acid a,c-diamide adenosyltransferase [Myxococcota bacterium]
MSDEHRFRDPKVTINRVYTRAGDGGETRLVGGQSVGKDDLRIEAYGTVDELNAFVGAAGLSCRSLGLEELAAVLERVQHALFNLGSLLATLPEDLHPQQPRVLPTDVAWLEADMDGRNEVLPTLRSFVLPGGNRANVELHQCRTICRRAERLCVRLARLQSVDPVAITYLNRLSDAFFVWSRFVCHATDTPETLWRPNLA